MPSFATSDRDFLLIALTFELKPVSKTQARQRPDATSAAKGKAYEQLSVYRLASYFPKHSESSGDSVRFRRPALESAESVARLTAGAAAPIRLTNTASTRSAKNYVFASF